METQLVFFNNSLNHHQVLVADELFNLLGDAFQYVVIRPIETVNLKGGKDYSDRSYCIRAAENSNHAKMALELARNAQVCVFGAESLHFAKERARVNPTGLSFEMGERWLKKGWVNVLSPRLMKWWVSYQTLFRNANFYKLCASAFAASDHVKLHSYKGRCFKWGYFTCIKPYYEIYDDNPVNRKVSLLWCARFLPWKHPELAIELSYLLKQDNRVFHLSMIGDGEMKSQMEKLIKKKGLEDDVSLLGNIPNDEVIKIMRASDIFLFTSDRNEGWGVVANEAMCNRCLLVGSDEIGSVPYLVRDGENGMIFKSHSIESLYEKVSLLLDNPEKCRQLAEKGFQDMMKVWNPRIAAKNLLQLIDDLRNQRSSFLIGPASLA